jgi:hypothetical protein
MDKINNSLRESMTRTKDSEPIKILVTGELSSDLQKKFGLQSMKGLSGMYTGSVMPADIIMLSESEGINSIEEDRENFAL